MTSKNGMSPPETNKFQTKNALVVSETIEIAYTWV